MKKLTYITLGTLVTTAWIVLANFTYLAWFPLIETFVGILLIELCMIIFGKIVPKVVRDLINNFVLNIVSKVLYLVIFPVALLYTIIAVYYKNGKRGTQILADYLMADALSLDQTGNVTGMYLFSDLFLKTGSTKQYGNPDETISHVTGYKEDEKELTWFGEFIVFMLNLIDKGHTMKARNAEQRNVNVRETYYKK